MTTKPACIFAMITLSLTLWQSVGHPQPGYQFGQNKVQYKNFKWQVLRTAHFDVHYYPEETEAAQDAARMAERGYAYLSDVLDHQITSRIPLVLYASLNDFQQTNVVDGLLGDGTRGVTESLKNRVVLPLTGSYREFNHVLVHELVHAFQFDLIKSSDNSGLGSFSPPLWFVEGMAEYLAVGMDNMTRMWVRDGLLYDHLLKVEQLNNTFDIRVYRLGESLWHYVGETHGKQKVGALFKAAVRLNDVEKAFKEQIGLDFKALTFTWHEHARKQVLPADSTLAAPAQIAQQLTGREGYDHRANLVPAVSPDGRHVVYVADKHFVDELYLLSENAAGGFSERRLIKAGRSRDFETLRFFDTSISWSRDGGRIAFVAKSDKDDAIYVMNPHTNEISHCLVFAELNGLLSPSFSPEGDHLVFVGMRGGRSDLYIVNLGNGRLRRLTKDLYAEKHPQWSPDGTRIVFATDRGRDTQPEHLLFGEYELALYSLADGEISVITDLAGNAINPQWSPDGRALAFVSDHQGIANVYRLDLGSKEIVAVTRLRNGVAGITEVTPAMSWSADGRVLVFSAFEKGGWHLYRMAMPQAPTLAGGEANANGTTVDAAPAGRADSSATMVAAPEAAWVPAIAEVNTLFMNYALAAADSIEKRSYRGLPKFTTAAIGAVFGGFFGTVGGAQFLFSDVMNHHNVILAANLRRDLSMTDVGVTYFNQARRLHWGVEVFQLNDAYGAFYAPTAAGFVKQTHRGGNAFTFFPFSRFARLELSAGATLVQANLVVDQIDFTRGEIRREESRLGRATFGQVGAAYVFDNTIYGPLGPFSGSRSRLEIQRTTNDLQFTTLVGDYRRYCSVKQRSVLAARLLAGASFDREAQVFQIGGPYTFRGADYGHLVGTKFVAANVEYRFPLFPFLPPSADFLSAAAFADFAGAWGLDIPGLVKQTFQPFSTQGGFHLQDLRGALGVGARLQLGYFMVKYEVAWPTDLRTISQPRYLFSLGTDF
ncbi:MAG: DPP IV N-terminal domain-containing protein [candidate division KSB1 bacterium]|nr:DPP IV N-terminal domain-containing protein [candidate division KSB1 bacterium]MDZ7275233.1 DPP IV N-terminal domain-containing protein [candidate division KSB1 bacterium]MDZ7287401.1 DPP IV N-terminal domain-containing protein [candidate division KSB1 bacterium]MDZ7299515.1 DPP IV N-terminal domain-containing protein [candidate division KSB1 bacterium]MDZ7305440.1 DPP IV N-terminal domain-containing protein [candidate division KSB1 bacterium]